MAWRLSGHLVESCNCKMFCPCWYGVREFAVMDEGWCGFTVAFRLRQGNSDGIDLGGRTVILAGDLPGPNLFDGNGTCRLYIDEGAGADQRQELEAIFQGQKGGPMEGLGALVAKWLSTAAAKLDFSEDGDSITVNAGEFGRIRSQRLRDEGGNDFKVSGGGFIGGYHMEAAELAPSSTRWSDAEMPRPFETRSGARGDFTWSG